MAASANVFEEEMEEEEEEVQAMLPALIILLATFLSFGHCQWQIKSVVSVSD